MGFLILLIQGVQIGDPVTLYCVFSNQVYNEGNMFWFKQITGEIPEVVARMQKFQPRPELYKEFNNSHLNVERAEADGIYRLTIPKMEPTDEAIYYCASRTDYEVNLINGTFLVLKGNVKMLMPFIFCSGFLRLHMFSMCLCAFNIHCTVLSETCTGEHSVYWFRAGSGESHPGVIYTPGNRSDECEKSPETPSPTQSCVYSLSKNNLGPSDAGTYYCAVATCGEILLGNGIKLDMATDTKPVVVGLAVALVLCGIGIIFLACTRSKEQVCDNCKGKQYNYENMQDNFCYPGVIVVLNCYGVVSCLSSLSDENLVTPFLPMYIFLHFHFSHFLTSFCFGDKRFSSDSNALFDLLFVFY
uniref:Ig-like domain-containing protein n=1 Tax=Salmo trutta TaxID=8032 RepID=A0A673W065_SALTR